jgi:predicted RNA binding protein YcfA (HicA-like mRNA interferase family)
MVREDGWFEVRCAGSHRQFHHATKPGTVRIAGKPSTTLEHGIVKSIKKQAGLQ